MAGQRRFSRSGSYLLLLLAAVLFAGGLFSSSHRLERAHEALLAANNESVWIAYQLEFELQRLLYAAERYLGGPAPDATDELRKRFDIFWSRLPVAIEGEDGALLRSATRIEELVPAIHALLLSYEPELFDRLPDPRRVAAMQSELEAFRGPLRTVILDAIGEASRRQSAVQASLAGLYQTNRLSIAGLGGSVAILLFLLWRERARTQHLLDITRRQARKERHLAQHDPLTGLANRRLFHERLSQAAGDGQRAALLLVDLDRFKQVNDTLGHGAGDLLLRAVAARMRRCVRHGDLLARFGGDEFAVIQYGVEDEQTVLRLGERLRRAVAEPFDLDGRTVEIGASVGAALLPDRGADAKQLLVVADGALYRAKKRRAVVIARHAPIERAS